MRFTSPLALFWLLAVPLIFILGWPARGFSRRREIASLVIRLMICLTLIMALAGLEINDFFHSNSLAVVFLLDVSDSMPQSTIRAAIDVIQEANQNKKPDDQTALILFGRDALVEKTMSTDPIMGALSSIPITNETDLSNAVNLGLALFPPGAARRMVILSDGAFTSGNGSDALQIAAASGVEIVILPFITEPTPEILVQQISVPPRLRLGDQFDLNITLNTNQAEIANVRVFADGSLIYEGVQEVNKGVQTFSLPLVAGKTGFTSYKVSVDSSSDQYYQNNQLSTYSQILGAPRILLVTPPEGELLNSQGELRPDEIGPLRKVLNENGFEVNQVIPEFFPVDLPGLAGYSSVIFVDVPAKRLTTKQMENLQSYVRDLGGGLVTIGGPTSYGVGGYYKTPLEETLPVDMQIKDEKRRPTLAIVFIVDRSGSMSETSGGPTKLELAKEAVIRSLDLLNPLDQVGVIAFDDAASWVVPIRELEDGADVKIKTASIGIGGGTDILAGMQTMAAAFPNVKAGSRHVILLTDGGADPSGIPELVKKLYTVDGITLSTIGVGQDAAPFLADLAEIGGGRYHFANDPESIPNIYTEETSLATRSYIIEEPFVPDLVTQSPILDGVDGIPELLGYVGTSAKNTAQTILISDKGDPILAIWRYGLGKAVAFTSDASGRWAKEWLAWSDFPVLWSQIVRYSIGNEINANLDIQTEYRDGKAHILVDTGVNPNKDESGDHFLNNITLEANIVDPSGNLKVDNLSQIAPGKYETEFIPNQEGVYLIRVVGSSPISDDPAAAEIAGWALDYSAEYRQLDPDPDNLIRLAYQAGGRLADQNPSLLFKHSLSSPGIYIPIWPSLLLTAVLLLPFDIAFRRLVITKSDIQRSRQAIKNLFSLGKAKTNRPIETSERMQGLLRIKQKSDLQVNTKIDDLKHSGDNSTKNKPFIIHPSTTDRNKPSPDSSNKEMIGDKEKLPESPEGSIGRLLERKRSLKNLNERKSK